jgi:hypothetical protein
MMLEPDKIISRVAAVAVPVAVPAEEAESIHIKNKTNKKAVRVRGLIIYMAINRRQA